MSSKPNSKAIRTAVLSAALAGGAFAGAFIAAPLVSGAQESTTTAPATSDQSTAPTQSPAPNGQAPNGRAPGQAPNGQQGTPPDPSKGGHMGQNGTKEELLTGDTADKVTAAALAANPGGTIERVENDADGGGVYEAHMTTADGQHVTVLLDANFSVTKTETGPGPR